MYYGALYKYSRLHYIQVVVLTKTFEPFKTYVMLCYAILCYARLRYVTLGYTTLRYVMLCHELTKLNMPLSSRKSRSKSVRDQVH